jgi:calcineurin-like phosphoesterase family protein
MRGSAPRRPSGRPNAVSVLAVSDEVDDALLADTSRLAGSGGPGGPGGQRTVDLILACGDLPFEYLDSLMNALDVPLVFVPGNHDPDLSGYRVSRAGLTLRAGLPARPPWPDGAVNADGRIVEAAGLRVAGLGGCLRYSAGPNQYTDGQQARRARALRARARWRRLRDGRGIDVLLTHAPPRGVGDGDDPPHRGFTALHGLVDALRPTAMLHGHVHPAYLRGEHVAPRRLRSTVICNVTGWRLFDIRPPFGLTEVLPSGRAPGRGSSGGRAPGHRDAR